MGVIVLPDQVAVGGSHQAFDEYGDLKDEKMKAMVEGLGIKLTEFLRTHKSK